MLLSIVIPCLNEASTIKKAVLAARNAAKKCHLPSKNYEIIVADNGSTDGSISLIEKQNIARIIHVPVRGYGAALHWGISKSRGEYVLFADADLSYDFQELCLFLPFIQKRKPKKNAPDVILGSRFTGQIDPNAMPFLNRYIGTPILSFLIRTMYHLPVSDSNSGMRLIRRHFYSQLNMRNPGMEWASELLIKTALHHGRYLEVPISLHKDKRGKKPHLAPWKDGWRHLKAILLLKPNILFLPVLILAGLGAMTSALSIQMGFLFFLGSYGLLLSIGAAKLLHFAIDQHSSLISEYIQQLPLVTLTGVFTGIAALQTIWQPDRLMEVRFFFVSSVIIFDIWTFFIETIKTHVLYRLPDLK